VRKPKPQNGITPAQSFITAGINGLKRRCAARAVYLSSRRGAVRRAARVCVPKVAREIPEGYSISGQARQVVIDGESGLSYRIYERGRREREREPHRVYALREDAIRGIRFPHLRGRKGGSNARKLPGPA